jgi:site-specific recombinase XerD
MSTALTQRLKRRGLLPSTRDKYQEILNAANHDDLLGWLGRKFHARTPLGTLLPARAAVKHFLISEHGYTEDELDRLLPKARGRSAVQRSALSPRQLAIYFAAADALPQEPARTVLLLLPKTGLRISEITGLRRENLRFHEGRLIFEFRGKGDKLRVVPLPHAAVATLEAHLEAADPSNPWLFPTVRGGPISPHGVRVYTRKLANEFSDLSGLSPHVLRHTYATAMLRAGVDIKRLQLLMGHSNIQTTQRYLHPSVTDLVSAVDKL